MKLHSLTCGYRCAVAALSVMLMVSAVEVRAQQQLQRFAEKPRLEISGSIDETTDAFGRKRFIGKVINREKKRIDFIRVEFTVRDKQGNVLETKSGYIKGQWHRFRDRQVSRSSLNAGATGNFDIITSVMADDVFSYTYKIVGMDFIYP